ncbi:3'-5' exonuclease, partial [Sanguibacter suaedae]
WQAADGRAFTAVGWTRLRALAQTLRDVRALTYLALPELVDRAERALGLDIEVALAAARAHTPEAAETDPRGRAHLDAFRQVAASFADSGETTTLGAFLAWLSSAEKRERGLERPTHAPDPRAVQLITVHASKGLEWDVVAVPGLVDGVFPSTRTSSDAGPTSAGWLTSLGALPFPLRGDARDLPTLDLAGAADSAELNARLVDFRSRCGEHEVLEERRLAYVAFTRARSELLLTGAWWRTAVKPSSPSPFLTELADAGVLAEHTVAPPPEPGTDNPRGDSVRTEVWPSPHVPTARTLPSGPGADGDDETSTGVRSSLEALRRARDLVLDELTDDRGSVDPVAPVAPLLSADGTDLAGLSSLLLAERDASRAAVTAMEFPAHISASGLVEVARDRSAYALALRRPVPREPSVHTRRGTAFHLWVEKFYGSTSLFDLDELPGADDDRIDPDRSLADLQRTFEASPWASLVPIEVEVAIDTVIAGVVTRTRIDAVFPDPENPGGVVVVDWKTGRVPTDDAAREAREVQLAVYRLAWSTWAGVPLDSVSAAFYHVADDTTVRPRRLADADELERLVRGELPAPASPPSRASSRPRGPRRPRTPRQG